MKININQFLFFFFFSYSFFLIMVLMLTVFPFSIKFFISSSSVLSDIGCMFVKVESGYYGKIFFCFSYTPYLSSTLYDLDDYFKEYLQ